MFIVVVGVNDAAPCSRQVEILRHVDAGRLDGEPVRHGKREIFGVRYVTERRERSRGGGGGGWRKKKQNKVI